jgi:hypothetical protein
LQKTSNSHVVLKNIVQCSPKNDKKSVISSRHDSLGDNEISFVVLKSFRTLHPNVFFLFSNNRGTVPHLLYCDNRPMKIPYYHLNQSTLVIKQ